MTTRRKFLKNAGILSAILALNPLKAEEILPKKKSENQSCFRLGDLVFKPMKRRGKSFQKEEKLWML